MSHRIAGIERLFPLVMALPEGQHFEITTINEKPAIQMRASGTERVSKIRACFGGLVWRKEKDEHLAWWEYTAETPDGIVLHIYADHVGPNSCKRVEEIVREVVQVPARAAHEEVRERKVVRWICPEDEATEAS